MCLQYRTEKSGTMNNMERFFSSPFDYRMLEEAQKERKYSNQGKNHARMHSWNKQPPAEVFLFQPIDMIEVSGAVSKVTMSMVFEVSHPISFPLLS